MWKYLELIRWDKPIGTWLLFWPCAWSIVFASAQPEGSFGQMIYLLALFFLGALVMRSAGCIMNDLWDREIDAQVERTKTRPLASGAISIRQALIFLVLLLLAALLIVLQLRIEVFWLALLALPMVAVYPLMKRITWWPQAFLGLTFNFGALMGWVAVTGELAWPALLLYLSGVFWTLGYDTIYAFQDREEDEQIGVKSTARRLYPVAELAIAVFYGLSYVFFLSALLVLNASIWALWGSLLPLFLFSYQIYKLNPDQPQICASLFKSSNSIGFSYFAMSFCYFLF